jgi:3-methyladenine DNA glycosylase AlkD
MDADAVADHIEGQLRAVGSAERAVGAQAYLKHDMPHIGASVPATRQVVAPRARGLERRDALALVEALWRRRIHECRLAAVEVLALHVQRLEPRDLRLIEQLLRDAGTWALVDPLAIQVVGTLVAGHAGVGPHLDRWITDPDHWVRRAALLALLGGVRAGTPDRARIDRFADAQLEEREFLIRKAIGWLLREVARADLGWVVGWLEPRVARTSGLTLREALKHLPEERQRLLEGRKAARQLS